MKLRSLLLCLALGLCWGPSYVCIKLGLQELPPITVAWARIFLGFCVLAIPTFLLKGFPSFDRQMWKKFFTFGLLSNIIPFCLLATGQQHISSALTAILNGTPPVITGLLAHWLISDEKLSRQKILGISLGVTGFLCLILPTVMDGTLEGDTFGILAVLGSCISLSSGIVYARLNLRGLPGITAPVCQLTASVTMITPIWLIMDAPWNLAIPSLKTLAAMGFLGFVGTGLAFVIYYRIVSTVGATALAMVGYLLPTFGTLFAILFLGESLSVSNLLGFGFIMTGMAFVNKRERTPIKV